MKAFAITVVFLFAFCPEAKAAVNFDTLTLNSWAQITTLYHCPGWGCETHLAFDTSGYTYMVGSCSYGGSAGGTHNNDIFRFNIKTGMTEKMLTCGTNPWPGGCQAGQVFDPNRNCIWFGPGNNAVCRSGVIYFPGQAYYGGLYRMNCPTTPIAPQPPPVTVEKIQDDALPGGYFLFDAANDLLLSLAGGWGCKITIYDPKTKITTSTTAPSPFADIATDGWHYTCCFDSKRSLVVLGQMAGMRDLWFYNTTTKTWFSKTPDINPPPVNVPLVYEPVMDKYVLFGTDNAGQAGTGDWHPQVWVYDFDSNSWTERPRGTLHYDTLTPANSTWPPLRTYPGCFGFSPKLGVLANWGGLPTNPTSTSKDVTKQPIWAFKLGAEGAGISRSPAVSINRPLISASPNPFKSSVTLTLSGVLANGAALKIFDVSGKLVMDLSSKIRAGQALWNAAGQPAGVYVITARKGAAVVARKVLLTE